jgi:type I restriction enzyme R subunit
LRVLTPFKVTRRQRAEASKPFISAQYEPRLQAFLNFVLAQYVKEGVGELDRTNLPHLLELKYRAINDAAAELGGVARIRDAFIGFQRSLYG